MPSCLLFLYPSPLPTSTEAFSLVLETRTLNGQCRGTDGFLLLTLPRVCLCLVNSACHPGIQTSPVPPTFKKAGEHMGILATLETAGCGTMDRSAPVFTGQAWGLQESPSKGAISSMTAVMCDHSRSQPTVVIVKAKIEEAGDSKG